jgi:hypothetical protein
LKAAETVLKQTHCKAASRMRSGAVGVCAAAQGLWRMTACVDSMSRQQYVISGKSRVHRVD